MKFTLVIALMVGFICSLVGSSAAATKAPKFPIPSGHYSGAYLSDFDGEGTAEITIDAKGRITGSGETSDGDAFVISGSVKVNQKTGVATGSLSYKGSGFSGKGNFSIEGTALSGTYSGKFGRQRTHGSFDLVKD